MEILIVMLIVVIILKNPKVKGAIGEWSVARILKRLDQEKYKVINDIYIPKEDGTTSQVDHIVVSDYGIFVIETKNYKGWIFGDEKNKFWTQTIYKKKSKFLNPIIQNKGHVKAVKNYLEIDKNLFISIVVFTTQADFKKVNTVTPVVYTVKLKKEIRSYQEIKLTKEEKERIYEKLVQIGKATRSTKKQHVKKIEEMMSNSPTKHEYMKKHLLDTEGIKQENEEAIGVTDENIKQTQGEGGQTDQVCKEELTEEDQVIHEKLKQFRLEKSHEEKIKPYLIYNNAELMELVKSKPQNIEELMNVKGFGKVKCEKYGDEIMKCMGVAL